MIYQKFFKGTDNYKNKVKTKTIKTVYLFCLLWVS